MELLRLLTLLFVLAVLLQTSCTDPTLVGADLLDEDRAEVGFTDSFRLKTTTLPGEPLQTFSPFLENQLDVYLFGNMNDPVFGQSSASLNVQVLPNFTNNNTASNNTNPTVFEDYTAVDSVVLLLPYSTSGFYGKTEGETFGMQVAELTASLNSDLDYFSEDEVMANPNPLTEHEFVVNTDSLEFVDFVGENATRDTVAFRHLRVPLPASLGDSLLQFFVSADSSDAYTNSDLFYERFPGFRLEPSTENEGMLQFFLGGSYAGINVYYRDSADVSRRYLYDFDLSEAARFVKFEHDYTGSKAEPYLNSNSENDSLFLLQGMAGLRGEITFPDLSALSNVAVNMAELEFFVADLDGPDTAFAEPQQLILLVEGSDGDEEEVLIEDFDIADFRSLDIPEEIGGNPEEAEGMEVKKYTIVISAHLQAVIEGTQPQSMTIIPVNPFDISPFKKAETASRVVLYGGNHPEFAPKLRVTFTQL